MHGTTNIKFKKSHFDSWEGQDIFIFQNAQAGSGAQPTSYLSSEDQEPLDRG